MQGCFAELPAVATVPEGRRLLRTDSFVITSIKGRKRDVKTRRKYENVDSRRLQLHLANVRMIVVADETSSRSVYVVCNSSYVQSGSDGAELMSRSLCLTTFRQNGKPESHV